MPRCAVIVVSESISCALVLGKENGNQELCLTQAQQQGHNPLDSKVDTNLINFVLTMESKNVPRTLFLLLGLLHNTVGTGFCFFLPYGQSQSPWYIEIC